MENNRRKVINDLRRAASVDDANNNHTIGRGRWLGRNILRLGILICMLIGLSLSLSGCYSIKHVKNAPSVLTYENSEKYLVGGASVTSDIKNLFISWNSGNVEIVEADTDKISFEESSEQKIPDDFTLRYLVEDDTLFIQFANTGSWDFMDFKKHLVITVPKHMEWVNVDLDSISADFTLAPDMKAKRLIMSTVSGDLKSTDTCVIDTIKFASISGDAMLTPREISEAVFETISGSTYLKLSEDMGFSLNCSTISGDFSSELDVKSSEDIYTRGDQYTAISVDTISGDVSLYKSK